MDIEQGSPKFSRDSTAQSNDNNATHSSMGQQQSSSTVHQSGITSVTTEHSPETGHSHESIAITTMKPEARILRYLEERQKSQPVRKEGPLQLLDLPLDILKDILKEVTHTNDLANLALVNSALHGIVTPLIYSRFDIVWPDSNGTTEPRLGVDALTYGLATLVMREDLFHNPAPSTDPHSEPCQSFTCTRCGSMNYIKKDSSRGLTTRRGNYYSQFTKKFSLGNGPTEWVEEYLVTKECGKMLGTLVALSIARMPNLDTFIWDMPTGLLRDVWIALASLGDCRVSHFEKLWVRMHDNQAALQAAGLVVPTTLPAPAQGPSDTNVTSLPPQPGLRTDAEIMGVGSVVWSHHHVEKPNFSILSPLKSLTVLNIDEVQYLVELSVLLHRSLDTLRELRLGIGSTLHMSGYTREHKETKHLLVGGVFGLLMDGICHQNGTVRESKRAPYDNNRPHSGTTASMSPPFSAVPNMKSALNDISGESVHSAFNLPGQGGPDQPLPGPNPPWSVLDDNAIDPALFKTCNHADQDEQPVTASEQDPTSNGPTTLSSMKLASLLTDKEKLTSEIELREKELARSLKDIYDPQSQLKLNILEIEKVTLNSTVVLRCIDFTMLNSLTLLQCGDTTTLWEELAREFPPRKSLILSTPARPPESPRGPPRLRRKPSSDSLSGPIEYKLNLRRIHTDSVSKELVTFLKNVLAPNSLQWMFLQDNASSPSTVSLDSIYRGPLRRHRDSLTKIMLDSAYGPSSSRARSVAARKWMFNREVLAFVTSGKMSRIRELAMSIEYKDWHFFLQKIPQIPHLRSIYLPYISDHPSGNSFSCREVAMGAVDVVAIRPDVQLCYLAIRNKCFEILEKKVKTKSTSQGGTTADGDSDDDSDGHDHHDEDNDSDESGAESSSAAPAPTTENNDSDAEQSPDTEDEDDGRSNSDGGRKVKYKLREILFYDDKISIFKARHGRL